MNKMKRDVKFHKHKGIVEHLVLHLLSTHDPLWSLKDDIIQDGYIKLLELTEKNYELHTATFTTYAYKSMFRDVLRIINSYRRDGIYLPGMDEDIQVAVEDSGSIPQDKFYGVQELIGGLNEDEARAYDLYYNQDNKLVDVARIMGKRNATIVKLLGGINERVRYALED